MKSAPLTTHLYATPEICLEQSARCRSHAKEVRHSPNWDSAFPEVRRQCRGEYDRLMAEAKRWYDKARRAGA